jgi:hypothetical protein
LVFPVPIRAIAIFGAARKQRYAQTIIAERGGCLRLARRQARQTPGLAAGERAGIGHATIGQVFCPIGINLHARRKTIAADDRILRQSKRSGRSAPSIYLAEAIRGRFSAANGLTVE